jgi:DTW domain-containing protein YfiP
MNEGHKSRQLEYCLLECDITLPASIQKAQPCHLILLVTCSFDPLTLKIEGVCSSETSANLYQTTWHRILEDSTLQNLLKSNKLKNFTFTEPNKRGVGNHLMTNQSKVHSGLLNQAESKQTLTVILSVVKL